MSRRPSIELWAGVESTVNRVGDTYFNQLEKNGHARRVEDLERFASLGIRALRYPVLWERHAPDRLEDADFTWADERLGKLRELGVRPIVGLVHHGSGPRWTSLIDPAFPEHLARYARAVAERYPWVDEWTPVNEPLTTARFSGLYGFWYPHGRDAKTFLRAVVTQCRGVVLAMRAIREVNPGARLIQTEDFGRTFSTPLLAYQAEHENHRRWLSYDLLTGRVDRDHPLFDYLVENGLTEDDLAFFLESPCPPDVCGINYYVTSERFLDEEIDRYPAWSRGGNGRHAYADVEAVRAVAEGMCGHQARLAELWERYRLPVAITEVHLGGTREEQLRWLLEAWNAARAVAARGADVRAVTVWSLLGAFDWNRLVTADDGFYESGVFDVRGAEPRPTALAELCRALASGAPYDHPVTAQPGWWRRPVRLVYAPVHGGACDATAPRIEAPREEPPRPEAPPILITGATGTLGAAFARLCELRGLPYRLIGRREMDIADPASVERALDRLQPWAVINTAGYVRVDDAERDRLLCMRENALGPVVLASACRRRGARLVTFSSDLVFDGGRQSPYVETDEVGPLNEYGRSKVIAERAVLDVLESALVIRTAAFFGPWDEYNFVAAALRALREGRSFHAAADQIVTPTYVPDLVHVTLDLLIDGERGIWHLANRDPISWAELAERSASLARLDPRLVVRCPSSALGLAAPRPAYSALGSGRGLLLPPLEEALARCLEERELSRPNDTTSREAA